MSFRRVAGLAGLAFVVLIAANVILLGDSPMTDDSVAEIRGYFAEDEAAHDAAIFLSAIALVPVVIFFAGLVGRIRLSDQATGESWSVAVLASAILLGASATAGDVIFATLALRGTGAMDPGLVRTLYDMQYLAYTSTGAGIAALGLTVAVPVLRHRVWPRWYGLVSGVVAILGAVSLIGVFSPDLEWTFIGFPALLIWVIVTSILLLRRGGEEADVAAVVVTETVEVDMTRS